MEETTPAPPAAPKKNIPIDLSNVGVPVDPRGHIVPIIDRDAPGGVRQNFSNLEVYSEPAINFVPAFGPYGQPYPGVPFGYGGAPYGAPLGPYGYGGFGSPYPYNSGIGINLGRNFRLNLGTPNPYGYGGFGGAPFGAGVAPFGIPGANGFGGSPFGYDAPFGANVAPFGIPGAGGYGGSPFGFAGSPLGYGGSPFGYGAGLGAGAPFGYSSPFGYGGGSSLFSTQTRGLGLNLFVPNNVEWQSSSTITPLTPNLDGPP